MTPREPRMIRACALLVMLAAPRLATAQEGAPEGAQPPPPPPAPAPSQEFTPGQVPRHAFGFGFGLGGGYMFADTTVGNFSKPQINLIDISFFIPLSPKYELHLWVPLAGVLLTNALLGPAFTFDLGLKIYPQGGGAGFFVEPGVNLEMVSLRANGVVSASAFGFAVPLRVGYEFASDARGFGFSMAGKPLLGVISASASSSQSSASVTALEYGFLVELSFNFYARK